MSDSLPAAVFKSSFATAHFSFFSMTKIREIQVYNLLEDCFVPAQVRWCEISNPQAAKYFFRVYATFQGRTRVFEAIGEENIAYAFVDHEVWTIPTETLNLLRPQAEQLPLRPRRPEQCQWCRDSSQVPFYNDTYMVVICNKCAQAVTAVKSTTRKTPKTRKSKIARMHGFNYTRRKNVNKPRIYL
jgi:hypothetical protein